MKGINKMKNVKIYNMALCGLFAAITAVLSQIAIPIGPVPINLATFAVFCAGALLGSKLGSISLIVWAILGAFGVPVFSMFRGGLGTLLGPTGGYIIGYIPAAFVIGLVIEKFTKLNKFCTYLIAMFIGMCIYFFLGTLWYMFSTKSALWSALTVCVFPFLIGDFLKLFVATLISQKLRPLLNKRMI